MLSRSAGTWTYHNIVNQLHSKRNTTLKKKPHGRAASALIFMFFSLGPQSIGKNFNKVSGGWFFRRWRSTDLIQGHLNLGFTLRVQCWGGLIQQEDLGVANQGSGDGDSLLLSTAQLDPSLSNQGVKFLQQKAW